MPNSRPTAPDLLDVVRGYLEGEVAPQLQGYHQFQLKIAARLLATLAREIRDGAGYDAAEQARLAALLQMDGDLANLNEELARRIRTGAIDIDDPALIAHLRQSLGDALRINNPKWVGES